jgi:uncharacterized protein YodC (DUF2158 family)
MAIGQPKYKTGDLVVLLSGSPTMTVIGDHVYTTGHSYHCAWFSGKKNEDAHFPEAALKAAPADTKE